MNFWASLYPIPHNFLGSFPPSEACLYGHINWSLAQTQQQTSFGLSQSSISVIGGRTRPGLKYPVAESRGGLWQRSLTQTLGCRVIQVPVSFLVVVHMPVSLTLRRRGTMGGDIPDILQSTTSSTSSLSVILVGTLPHFLGQ